MNNKNITKIIENQTIEVWYWVVKALMFYLAASMVAEQGSSI